MSNILSVKIDINRLINIHLVIYWNYANKCGYTNQDILAAQTILKQCSKLTFCKLTLFTGAFKTKLLALFFARVTPKHVSTF